MVNYDDQPEILDGCCVNQVSNPKALSPTRCVRCGQHLIVRNRMWVRYQPKEGNYE